ISLMTLHGAKGLEFQIVFLPGWEEDIFPSRLSLEENGTLGLEEERRLAYVGITRARMRAYISHVANRQMHGSWMNALPSRFLNELPDEHVQRHSTINFGQRSGARNAWQREEKERTPPLWEQLRAGQNRAFPPRLQPRQIEGKAYEVKMPKREGQLN